MARIKAGDIVSHLSREITKALEDTMSEFAPHVRYKPDELFSFFQKRVCQHCGSWETVPDDSVQK
jgi:hypothetical protein